MIFGRPANLAMGLGTAIINVLALSNLWQPHADLLAGINLLLAAAIAFFGFQTSQALSKVKNGNGT